MADRPALLNELALVLELPERLDRLEELLRQIDAKLDAVAAAAPPALMDVEQFAARVGVGPATVRRWAASGEVPARRMGRRWMIDAAAVRVRGDSDRIQQLADEARGRR